MNNLVTVLITLLMLSALVVMHEFGHYFAAKKCDVCVLEFSIGMGQKIFARQGKETLFCIRALPIGGYCRMYGEDDGQTTDLKSLPETAVPERSFQQKSKVQRFLILAAGPMMNLIFGMIGIFTVYLLKGATLTQALRYTPYTAWSYATLIIKGFGLLLSGQAGISQFSGPIGMVGMVKETVAQGFVMFLVFLSYISVNLGVLNLMPFPALDGGQILLLIVEKIIGKPVSEKIVSRINLIGFALLMGFAFVVAVNDIFKLF